MLSSRGHAAASVSDGGRPCSVRCSHRCSPASTSFRGFSENELDLLFPYLNIVEFQNGDPIMKRARRPWTGIVLGGELEARRYTGAVIGRVMPGTVVGEMALFRGGKRGLRHARGQLGRHRGFTLLRV